jgi:hypothetical protein
MIVVLAAVLLTGRIWRLGEPYQMHFDEVYHPRTATEFLQYWRYGMNPPTIYEWTHPHLAKYGMALGLMAWGEDRTAATSELGVDVRSAAVEPRWDDAQSVSRIAGDRLWIATGDEVRAYDLATRRLEASVPVPGAVAVSVDRVTHRVAVGTTDGAIRRIDTKPLDEARWAGTTAAATASAFSSVDGQIERIFVPAGGAAIVVVLAGESAEAARDVVVFDARAATETGRFQRTAIAQIADAGAGTVALADSRGVAFVDTVTATVATTVELEARASASPS